MLSNRQTFDYEPVTPSRRGPAADSESTAESCDWSSRPDTIVSPENEIPSGKPASLAPLVSGVAGRDNWILKRGHFFSYVGLFLFTFVLYFRPYELIAALSSLTSIAFWLAVFTLAVFIPSQLALEGNFTARPREVNLVLLLCLAALLSMPLAISPGDAWETFNQEFIKAVLMFIVMINVVRTERRLKGLFFLALAIGCVLSGGALNAYQQGNLSLDGYRIAGIVGGMFGNPNDMAIHLVTIIPICIALLFTTRGLVRKALYGACAALLLAGLLVTFSRGGFLGMMGAGLVLAWKIGRRNRVAIIGLMLAMSLAFVVFAPSGYTDRLTSIVDHSRDQLGSASARQELLFKSIKVALRHPLFGVGMGNFPIVSTNNKVSHNAYTQVAADMGLAAMLIYIMFIVAPLRRLREIERDSLANPRTTRFYYLAVGLQASLTAYMISSFFGSVAYQWYVYYLVAYAVCLRRIYVASLSGAAVGADAGGAQPVAAAPTSAYSETYA